MNLMHKNSTLHNRSCQLIRQKNQYYNSLPSCLYFNRPVLKEWKKKTKAL